MSIDGTISEFYFRSSIKKYLIDNLYTNHNILLLFDRTILYEEVASYDVTQWIVVTFGQFTRDTLMGSSIVLNCCTRQDTEGVRMSKLSDLVFQYLYDPAQTDTLQRIPLYDTHDPDPTLWTQIGGMVVLDVNERQPILTPDKTKVKAMSVPLAWGGIC